MANVFLCALIFAACPTTTVRTVAEKAACTSAIQPQVRHYQLAGVTRELCYHQKLAIITTNQLAPQQSWKRLE